MRPIVAGHLLSRTVAAVADDDLERERVVVVQVARAERPQQLLRGRHPNDVLRRAKLDDLLLRRGPKPRRLVDVQEVDEEALFSDAAGAGRSSRGCAAYCTVHIDAFRQVLVRRNSLCLFMFQLLSLG